MRIWGKVKGVAIPIWSGVVVLLLGTLLLAVATAEAQEIQLIVRGDDFGMTQGSLDAVEKAMNEGVMTATSIIVSAPWFEGAAELARKNPSWCTGIHLALVGEWRGYRWRPVLPWDKVRSMVDAEGFLFTSPRELWANKPKVEELDAELRAQVELAKKKGVKVQYVDVHYVHPEDYPGVQKVVEQIASDYHVPLSGAVGEMWMQNVYHTPIGQKKKRAMEVLDGLGPGLWLWMCHVGIDSPEQRALIHSAPEDIFVEGGVGLNRAEELNVLTSIEIKSVILKKGIKLTNYGEIWSQKH